MSEYYIYKAGLNERWDSLAYRYYGSAYKMAAIIQANPHIPISPYIAEGTLVRIPVLESASVDTSVLPVWKRA